MKDMENMVDPFNGEFAEAHQPIEMDPVADFEKARAAMEAQIHQLNEELNKTREAWIEEKQERDLLIIQRDTARKEREQAQQDCKRAEEKIYAMRRSADRMIDSHERELENLRKKLRKPILRPCLAIAGFSVLSMLIGMAVNHALVASRLGEPLGYGCIGIAAFFCGIIWERLGGWCYGGKRVCGSKLGAERDCKSCGDHS